MTDFEEAFGALYPQACRVAYRLLGRREEAEDVAQEALARAYVRWAEVARHPNPTGWVLRVTGNLAIDAWRKRRRSGPGGEEAIAIDAPNGDRVDLHRALATLPRRQREVVVLRYVADLSEEQVADVLGVSLGTVRQHAFRGRAALRGRLESPPEELVTEDA